MTLSSPTRMALGDPPQVCPPDPAACFTTTAIAGPGGPMTAGAASSSFITHQQYPTYREDFAFYEPSRLSLAFGADLGHRIPGPRGRSGHPTPAQPRGRAR